MDTRARNYDFQGSALPEVMQAGQDQVTMADNGESIDPNLVSVELSTSMKSNTPQNTVSEPSPKRSKPNKQERADRHELQDHMIDLEVAWINKRGSIAHAPTSPIPPAAIRAVETPAEPLIAGDPDSDIIIMVSNDPAGRTKICTRWTTTHEYNGYGNTPEGKHAEYLRQLPGVVGWQAVRVHQSIAQGPLNGAYYGDHYVYLYEVPCDLNGTKYHYESIVDWLVRFEDNDDLRTFLRRLVLQIDDRPLDAAATAAKTPEGGSTTPPPTPPPFLVLQEMLDLADCSQNPIVNKYDWQARRSSFNLIAKKYGRDTPSPIDGTVVWALFARRANPTKYLNDEQAVRDFGIAYDDYKRWEKVLGMMPMSPHEAGDSDSEEIPFPARPSTSRALSIGASVDRVSHVCAASSASPEQHVEPYPQPPAGAAPTIRAADSKARGRCGGHPHRKRQSLYRARRTPSHAQSSTAVPTPVTALIAGANTRHGLCCNGRRVGASTVVARVLHRTSSG